jgi:hypothetical protein
MAHPVTAIQLHHRQHINLRVLLLALLPHQVRQSWSYVKMLQVL